MRNDTKRAGITSLPVLFYLFLSTILFAQSFLSPEHIIYSAESQKIFISQRTAGSVAVFDEIRNRISTSIKTPNNPAGLTCTSNGKLLYVVESAPAGYVHKVDVHSGKISASCPVGHSPEGIALSPDEKMLFVCNRFTHDVSVIETESMREKIRIPVVREPVALSISPDSRLAAVANLLPSGSMKQEIVSADISFIDLEKMTLSKNIPLPNGSTALMDVIFSPDGRYVYVTHILARYQLPTTQLERGWMNTNALSIIDADFQEYINTVLLDDVDRGAANPCGLAISNDGLSLYIALSGTHELCVIDRVAMHEKLQAIKEGAFESDIIRSVDDVYVDLSFLYNMKKRIPLKGKSPRQIAVSDGKIYVTDYFSNGLDVLDENELKSEFLPLSPETACTTERLGEFYFHDANLCFQNWQSCASCHPGGARMDGLNWDLLNDGIGNPKNTKSLLLSHVTPPAMITGIRPDAETAVRAGIQYIQFVVRPDEDAAALDAYLKSLQPVPSPFLQRGKLTRSAKRGKKIFQKAGCSACHATPYFTDGQKYDVGTGVDRHKGAEFDTPALFEVWRTAPYLYDGRAATLKQVFTDFNPEDLHGRTSGLTDGELEDLIEFVNSL